MVQAQRNYKANCRMCLTAVMLPPWQGTAETESSGSRGQEVTLTECGLQDCVLETVLHVPLVSLCKWSSHSCKSWLVLQDTVIRSIIFPVAGLNSCL